MKLLDNYWIPAFAGMDCGDCIVCTITYPGKTVYSLDPDFHRDGQLGAFLTEWAF